MVAKSDSGHTLSMEHEAPMDALQYGSDEQIQLLMKFNSVQMPTERLADKDMLNKVRSSNEYIYVMNWLYVCRGFVKLQSEHFDVDLFEIELLNLVNPPPVDESILLINKLKRGLTTALKNPRLSYVSNFEHMFRIYFGVDTPLGGKEDENDEIPEPTFEDLLFGQKFEILFTVLSYVSSFSSFRNFMERGSVPFDNMKASPLYSEVDRDTHTTTDYLLLFECQCLVKRTASYPELIVEKKKPDGFSMDQYDDSQFDVTSVEFEILARGIYQLNSFLLDIYDKRKQKKYKTLYSHLATDDVFDSLYAAEIIKRKILVNRKKELQLANLLATRKRSSRLEAKEKQKEEELKLFKIQEQEEMRHATERRLEKRRRMKEEQEFQREAISQSSTRLSREERLKQRKLGLESPLHFSTSESEPTATPRETAFHLQGTPEVDLKPSQHVDERNSTRPAESTFLESHDSQAFDEGRSAGDGVADAIPFPSGDSQPSFDGEISTLKDRETFQAGEKESNLQKSENCDGRSLNNDLKSEEPPTQM